MKYKLLKELSHAKKDYYNGTVTWIMLPPCTIIELSEQDAEAGVKQGMFEPVEDSKTPEIGGIKAEKGVPLEAIGEGVGFKEKGILPSEWVEAQEQELKESKGRCDCCVKYGNHAHFCKCHLEWTSMQIQAILDLLDMLHKTNQIKLPDINNKDL